MLIYDKDTQKYIKDVNNDDKYTATDFESLDSVDTLFELLKDKSDQYNYNDSNGLSPLCFATLNNVDPLIFMYLLSGKYNNSIKIDPIINGNTVTIEDGNTITVKDSADKPIVENVDFSFSNQSIDLDINNKHIKLSPSEIKYNNVITINPSLTESVINYGDKTLKLGIHGFEYTDNNKTYKIEVKKSFAQININDNKFKIDNNTLYINDNKLITISASEFDVSHTINGITLSLTKSKDSLFILANNKPIPLDPTKYTTINNIKISVNYIANQQIEIKFNSNTVLKFVKNKNGYILTLDNGNTEVSAQYNNGALSASIKYNSASIDLSVNNTSFVLTLNNITFSINILLDGLQLSINTTDSKLITRLSSTGLLVKTNNDTLKITPSLSGITFALNNNLLSLSFNNAKLNLTINDCTISKSLLGEVKVNNIPLLNKNSSEYYWYDKSDNKHSTAPKCDITQMCNKGKNAIQMAILSNNSNLIDLLSGKTRIEVPLYFKHTYNYIKTLEKQTYTYYCKKEIDDSNYQPIYLNSKEKKYVTGNIKFEQGTFFSISEPVSSVKNRSRNLLKNSNKLNVTAADIFDAASSPKVDLLKSLSIVYSGNWYADMDHDNEYTENTFNEFGYTPLMMATQFSCYDSVDLILDKCGNNKSLAITQRHSKIADTENSDQSALDIAFANFDIGIITKFYQEINKSQNENYKFKYIESYNRITDDNKKAILKDKHLTFEQDNLDINELIKLYKLDNLDDNTIVNKLVTLFNDKLIKLADIYDICDDYNNIKVKLLDALIDNDIGYVAFKSGTFVVDFDPDDMPEVHKNPDNTTSIVYYKPKDIWQAYYNAHGTPSAPLPLDYNYIYPIE